MSYLVVKLALLAVVGIGAIVGAVGRARIRARKRAQMLAAGSRIVDLAPVTLTGTVRALGVPLTAPLSGTPCVAYASTLRLLGGGDFKLIDLAPVPLRNKRRHVVGQTTLVDMCDFILETAAGDVRVCGQDVELLTPSVPVIPRQLDLETAFLARCGLAAKGSDLASVEALIEVGARVSVHGVARVTADPAAGAASGYREAATTVRIVGDAEHPVTIDAA